jgi:hypothetical protein
MARVAASFRRSGKADPVDTAYEITPAFLATLGVDELQTAMARGYLSCIRNMCRTGEYGLALDALKLLHSPDFQWTDDWVLADSFLWEAKVYLQQKSLVSSLPSISRAVAIRPKVLGRPLKTLAAWLRSLFEPDTERVFM